MQSRIFSAAVAALAFSSVNAAAVEKRQGNSNNVVVIQPGSIVTPQILFDPQALGAEALAYRALDQLRDDLSRTSALVSELNKAIYTNLDAKKAQADAVVRQVQANADAIRIKLESLGGTLQSKIPAVPTGAGALPTGGAGGSGGGAPAPPPLPTNSLIGSLPTGVAGGIVSSVAYDLPAATQTAIGTVGGIVDRVDAVIAQARTLNSQTRSQINQVGSFLETLLTPIVGQIKTESAKAIATSLKQISTNTDTFLNTVQSVAVTGQGTAQILLARLAAARVSINPTLIAGISPDVNV